MSKDYHFMPYNNMIKLQIDHYTQVFIICYNTIMKLYIKNIFGGKFRT